jgi:hypothetical protein
MGAGLACVMLAACVSDQSAAIPPDPAAPFPLAQSRILAQPSPGAIIVETRRAGTIRATVARAARHWCAGPAQTTLVSNDQDLVPERVQTWLIRCD